MLCIGGSDLNPWFLRIKSDNPSISPTKPPTRLAKPTAREMPQASRPRGSLAPWRCSTRCASPSWTSAPRRFSLGTPSQGFRAARGDFGAGAWNAIAFAFACLRFRVARVFGGFSWGSSKKDDMHGMGLLSFGRPFKLFPQRVPTPLEKNKTRMRVCWLRC